MNASALAVNQVKAVISVADMCRQLGMSRSHFYWHLKRGNFHRPLKLASNGRPYFTADMAEENMRVKETGVNINGEYVIFYDRRPESERHPIAKKPRPQRSKQKTASDSSLAAGLKSLGLDVTSDQIDSAISACFPTGTDGVDEAHVLRAAFRHLKRSGTV